MIPKLLVGLGNPGPKYTETRHDAGFWFVDRLVTGHGASFRREAKFHGDTAMLRLPGHDCRVLKPSTFMNECGRSVQAAMHFYALKPAELLVVHDEIDLPPGVVRLKRGGGHGGHNGLRDILECLGEAGFLRLRLGVGHPGHADQVIDYVLDRPSVSERTLIDEAIMRALEVMPLVFDGHGQKAMTKLHTNGKPQATSHKPQGKD